MAGTLNSLSHTALILQRVTSDTARENLTLLVQELLQELRVFVVNVLDTALLEATILFPFDVNCLRSQKAYFL